MCEQRKNGEREKKFHTRSMRYGLHARSDSLRKTEWLEYSKRLKLEGHPVFLA